MKKGSNVMIGREKEINELNKLYNSEKAEFVAIYGRRRVGKTFLVNETFKGRISFHHAGLPPLEMDGKGSLATQLNHFYVSLRYYGMKEEKIPESWFEAFYMLEKLLDEKDDGTRQVVFIDEMPWMDTPQSGFIRAFEGFWNNWGCHKKNLMVIVCGSANSWILDKLINNHGGLYGRVTYEIKLSPFTLKECEEFINCNDDIPVKYARDGFYVNLDFDIYEPDYKFNPAKTLLPKLYKNSVPELTKKELKMLKLFWGILDGHAKTYQQMSLILEIKTKKIKQMLKDATRKLVTE